MTTEVEPPGGSYDGTHTVWATNKGAKGWNKLCQSHAGTMRRCYIDLADHPFPQLPSPRHHRLKGRLKSFWEWEVGGGSRVRYKPGEADETEHDPVVVYGGPAPPDTH